MTTDEQQRWMLRALELADRAAALDEVPVGALVVQGDEVLGEGWNQVISAADPTAHAEVVALRAAASRVGNYRLPGATLFVTLEPCAMCAGAMVRARIPHLLFDDAVSKDGIACSRCQLLDEPWLNHRVTWQGGVMAQASSDRLQAFFKARR